MLSKSVLSLAARIDRSLERSYNEYLEACEADRADGYRPHYCEHGTSQWTDYDNICGPCEDGVSMGDPLVRREFAIAEAKHKESAMLELLKAGTKVRDELAKVGVEFDMSPIWKRFDQIFQSCDRY